MSYLKMVKKINKKKKKKKNLMYIYAMDTSAQALISEVGCECGTTAPLWIFIYTSPLYMPPTLPPQTQ